MANGSRKITISCHFTSVNSYTVLNVTFSVHKPDCVHFTYSRQVYLNCGECTCQPIQDPSSEEVDMVDLC